MRPRSEPVRAPEGAASASGAASSTPNGPGAPDGAPRPRESRRTNRVMLWFFLVVIAFAGLAFFFKLYEFFYDLASHEGFEFTTAHLMTYLLVAGGFFLLLLFAFLRGHFADIEKPKYDILDSERRHDRDEFA